MFYLSLISGANELTNSALKKAIIYIGKKYGRNAYVDGLKNDQYLNTGIEYIGKKSRHMSKTAIKNMMKGKKCMKNKVEWRFHKRKYHIAYKTILKCLCESSKEDIDEVIDLLTNFFIENRKFDISIKRVCSQALLFHQMKLLSVNRANQDQSISIHSTNVYNNITSIDNAIPERRL